MDGAGPFPEGRFVRIGDFETDEMYELFSFYVWIEPGGNGVFGAEYSLSSPETYFIIGVSLNSAYVSSEMGDPYSGHSVSLSMCANDWLWFRPHRLFVFPPRSTGDHLAAAAPGVRSDPGCYMSGGKST